MKASPPDRLLAKLILLQTSHYLHYFMPGVPRALSLGLLITLELLALFPYLWRQVESKVAYRERDPGIKQWCCGW